MTGRGIDVKNSTEITQSSINLDKTQSLGKLQQMQQDRLIRNLTKSNFLKKIAIKNAAPSQIDDL